MTDKSSDETAPSLADGDDDFTTSVNVDRKKKIVSLIALLPGAVAGLASFASMRQQTPTPRYTTSFVVSHPSSGSPAGPTSTSAPCAAIIPEISRTPFHIGPTSKGLELTGLEVATVVDWLCAPRIGTAAPTDVVATCGISEFGPCPPYQEFSDGDNCIPTYTCTNWFQCDGGLDDFECYGDFKCKVVYDCKDSFDPEDCVPSVTCLGSFVVDGCDSDPYDGCTGPGFTDCSTDHCVSGFHKLMGPSEGGDSSSSGVVLS